MPAALLIGFLLAQGTPVEPPLPQQGQSEPAPAPDSPQLARIRKALEQPAPIATAAAAEHSDKPVFRLTVRGWKLPPPWEDWTPVPSYVRPGYPLYHYDFLQMVTPEAFRASTLYPGMNLWPFFQSVAKSADAASRRKQEAAAREEVGEALQDLKDAAEHGPPIQTVIKGGVEIRMITILVRSKDSGPPRHLAQQDFTVIENRVKQTTSVFVKRSIDPTTDRYQLGYPISQSNADEPTHIEVRIRGLRRRIAYDIPPAPRTPLAPSAPWHP
jgi:hypothetical protein